VKTSHTRWYPFIIATSALALAAASFVSVPALTPALSPTAAAAATSTCTSAPFVSAPKAKRWYRIPALVRTGSGALIAFAERRDNASTTDRGNYDLVARTSTDSGCHWGPLRVVADYGRNHISSPVPIWDAATQSVLVFTSLRNTADKYIGLFLQRSFDDGATWSSFAAGQVTRPATGWKGGLQGPGHGLVLHNGTASGRIIFAMGYVVTKGHTKQYGTYGLYSDDGGTTWKVGYDRLSPGKLQLIEGTIAELPDGRLLVSYRDKRKTKPGTNRVSAISTNGGLSISSYRHMSGITTMAVEGSLLQTSGSNAPLLFSAPSFTKTKNLTIRRDMRIFISTNGGTTWRKGPLLGGKGRPAAYSDLVEINASRIGVLYETGKRTWRERIEFVQVSRSALR
jgi:sialidase-1